VPVFSSRSQRSRSSNVNTSNICRLHVYLWAPDPSGWGPDCKLGLTIVRPNLLSVPEPPTLAVSGWHARQLDWLPHIMSALGVDIFSCSLHFSTVVIAVQYTRRGERGWLKSRHTAEWNRVSGSPGHRVSDFGRVGSSHGSVCQTRCLIRFWVLTCAFIVALFLQSNIISQTAVSVRFPSHWGSQHYWFTYFS